MEDLSPISYATPGASYENPAFRPLPLLITDESRQQRLTAGVVACLLALAYFYFIFQYWAPAHNGVDQNGYLVGGKQLALTGSTGMKPANPLGFVSNMWVLNEKTGWNYPKYPVGLPLLYAIALWTCGHLGPKAAFLVSPIGAATAVAGMYFLTRKFAGTFASLLAMLLMAFGQVMLVLSDNPNSHASCVAFCVWGVYVLIRFWETGSIWRGFLGGFLIGYAATIRYTEGLMGLLVAFVAISSLQWGNWRSWLRCLTPALGWAIPVAYLVGFNLVAMHTPTGYDTTNESVPGAAFTVDHVSQNWEKLVRQVHDSGLFFTLPLGILGMGLALRQGVRRGALLWLWLVPGTITYMAYYWAPERGVSYLRFFLTLMPPIVVGAGVLIDTVLKSSAPARLPRVLTPLACGFVVVCACSMSLYRGLYGIEDGVETGVGMESQFRQQVNLAALADVVVAAVPAKSVLIAPPQQLNALQFSGNWECFSTETFTASYAQRLKAQEERHADEDPDPLQPARRRFVLSTLEDKNTHQLLNDEQLGQMQIDLAKQTIADGRHVYIVCRKDQTAAFMKRYEKRSVGLTWKVVASYNDLPRLHPDDTPPADPTDPRQRMLNNMGPGGRRNGGGMAGGRPNGGPNGGMFRGQRGGGGNFGPREVLAAWQVIEIKARPS